MFPAPSGDALGRLGILLQAGRSGDLTDVQLLDRFARDRDESAFAMLVERHGAMVLRVCRAVLADENDAHDAFQATFLVLVRRAHEVDGRRTAGPWLFGVSHRIALRVRRDAARRHVRERQAAETRPQEKNLGDRQGRESWPELHAELRALPEKYRAPVVLCYLEGRTAEEVARMLGCPRGTVLSRLARARERLRGRLARRGLLVPAATPFPEVASAPVPATLAGSAAKAAVRWMGGTAEAGTNSAEVFKLAEGAMTPMMPLTSKVAISALMSIVGVAAAVASARHSPPAGQQSPTPRPPSSPAPGSAPAAAEARQGDKVVIPRVIRESIPEGQSWATFCVAYSPDGKMLASGGADRIVRLRDAATGANLATIRPTPRAGNHADVMSLAFSPDGVWLATGCDDLTIRLHDVATAEERTRIPVADFSNAVAFSPDGRTLAWAGSYPSRPNGPPRHVGVISLWDMNAGKVRATLPGHADGVGSLAFSADGALLISGGYDRSVRIWDAATGKQLAVLPTPRPVHGVAISPDGLSLAAATGNQFLADDARSPNTPGVVMLWDVPTRKERALLSSYAGSALAVAFSPDGKALASGGQGGMLELWDSATGHQRAILRGHEGYVYSVAFSPDGKALASGGIDATVRLWDPADLVSSRAGLR